MENRKIFYKEEKDKSNYEVRYYLELNFEDKKVWWSFYPVAPKEIHWKKADEMGGLGVNHHTDTQSFEAFLKKPKLEIPKQKYRVAVLFITQYLEQR